MLLITTESNRLEAHASPTREASEAGAITRDQVMEALAAHGVVFGIDDTAVAAIIDGIEKGDREMSRVMIARGEAPTEGEPPAPEFSVEANALVRSGASLVTMTGGTLPRPGRNVCGDELPAPPAPSDPVTAGDHVEYGEEDCTFRAQVSGYVTIEGSRIGIAPLIVISDDGMIASLRWRSMDEDTTLPSLGDLTALLNDAGVVEAIDQEALQRVLDMRNAHADDDEPSLIMVARGTEMQRGDDASFEFHVEGGRQAGELLPDGRMDYHQQYLTSVVETGHLIVEKTPATEGHPGRTVRGEEVPAEPGRDHDLQPGENIAVSSDGLSFTAACSGVVIREGDSFRIVVLFAVHGDVDFSTGDLNFECSGVHVDGSIRSTFSVQASGSIVVRDSVEDAIVRSGEDVNVGKGVLHQRLGSLTAAGRVTAAYVQNAQISAGDEIVIRDTAFRSFLAAKNRIVLVDGKGVLMGGHAVAGESIEVKVAGSDAYVRTVIQVGIDFEKMQDLEERLAAVETELAGLTLAFGEGLAQIVRVRASPPQDRRRRALFERCIECDEKREALRAERTCLLEESRGGANQSARIIIRELVHPGVELIIAERTHTVEARMAGVRFTIDPETDEITQESI